MHQFFRFRFKKAFFMYAAIAVVVTAFFPR